MTRISHCTLLSLNIPLYKIFCNTPRLICNTTAHIQLNRSFYDFSICPLRAKLEGADPVWIVRHDIQDSTPCRQFTPHPSYRLPAHAIPALTQSAAQFGLLRSAGGAAANANVALGPELAVRGVVRLLSAAAHPERLGQPGAYLASTGRSAAVPAGATTAGAAVAGAGHTAGAGDGIRFADRAAAVIDWAFAPQPPRLGVRQQIDALVNMAKDTQVLARAYAGWAPAA